MGNKNYMTDEDGTIIRKEETESVIGENKDDASKAKSSVWNRSFLFVVIGLVLILCLVWAGFSWETKETEDVKLKKEVKMEMDSEFEEIIIEELKKPENQMEMQAEDEDIIDVFEVVEDD